MTYTKTPPTCHVKVPSYYVIATFQLYGSLMLESPDYFFRVREIGRLRQTNFDRAAGARARAHINVHMHGLAGVHTMNVHVYMCAQLHNVFFYGALPQTGKNEWNKCKNHFNEMKGDVGSLGPRPSLGSGTETRM